MCRVCRTWLMYLQTDLEPMFIENAAESVSPSGRVAYEGVLVHIPEFRPSHTGIILANFSDILQCELLPGSLGMGCIRVVLIVSLLAYANQSAEALDAIASRVLCVQVSYCLAPAFFLIGSLNLASATLIISS